MPKNCQVLAANPVVDLAKGSKILSMDEKRRDPRFKSDQKLWYEGQYFESEAVTRAMGRGGIAIKIERPSEVGTEGKNKKNN